MFVLVVVAIAGPIYAFVVMSCVSMARCKIGRLVWSVGMVCAEGEIEELMHGEVCTLICPEGFEPTSPQLYCQDGHPAGSEGLKCKKKKVFVAPEAAGLVDGAVTTRPLRTACERARNLKCDATPGGSALLLQIQNMTRGMCSELYDECKLLNPVFTFSDHVRYQDQMQKDPVIALGSCTFGCFIPPETDGWYLPGPTEKPKEAFKPPAQLTEDLEYCPGTPGCVNVNTSCNDEDNNDYYRYPTCASSRPQWVTLDEKRRIRFDSQPQYSQGGKWIFERDVNPQSQEFGEEIARQPTFDTLPIFKTTDWNFKCYRWLNPQEYIIDYKPVEILLQPCTCDSWNDCTQGQGIAVGSKEIGPNCRCECKPGFRGERCEIKLCKVPDVLNAAEPACAEGRYIEAGKSCTPMCNEGYAPTYESFRCSDDGTVFSPGGFECRVSKTLPPQQDDLSEFGIYTTTLPPDCSAIDCSYRGTPTGKRNPDGSCICECYANFTGATCRDWMGTCKAPLPVTIPNVDAAVCKEGVNVPTVCTAMCADGYFPLPTKLECMDDYLDPPTFGCYGGESVRDVWCQTMQEIAMYSTIAATVMLVMFCFAKYKVGGYKIESFFWRGETFEVQELDDGKVYVVQPRGKDDIRRLPKRIENRMHDTLAQEKAEMLAIEEGRLYTNSLFQVEEIVAEQLALSGDGTFETQTWILRDTDPSPFDNAAPEVVGFEDEDGDLNEFKVQKEGHVDYYNNKELVSRNVKFISVVGSTVQFKGQDDAEHQQLVVPPDQEFALPDLASLMRLTGGDEVIEMPDGSLCLERKKDVVEVGVVRAPYEKVPYVNPKDRAEHARKEREAYVQAQDPEPEFSQDMSWSMKVLNLENNALEARREHGKRMQKEQNKAAAAATANIATKLESTATERSSIDAAIRDAMQRGDGVALKAAVLRGHEMLKELQGLPPGPTAAFKRLILIAETRVEQYEEREQARKAKQEHEQRVQRGEAPDWTITLDQLWRYAEEGNVEKVRAGLKAQLPVMPKSKDGRRLTVLHVACRGACKEGEEMMERRLQVVEALVNARAAVNAADIEDRTPLDLAVCEGGPGSEDMPVVAGLRRLGLMSLREAGEAASKAQSLAPSPTSAAAGGASPKFTPTASAASPTFR
eukprot:TRINITY_DN26820_c0_g7_i1.p1 TRINITY_DN26820_c0_g7~~TRINITY_DN26820_c0_g7_i1.p1  ORF type:complete len:1186 (+),score=256.20 TRINITY_DN26820_c0_g7_i1:140-3559(+)